MKIGFFTDSYRPYVSGVVQSIDTFSRELMRRGHEIYVFAPRYPHNGGKEVNIYRFPSFHTPFYPDFYIGLPIRWSAKKYVQEWNLDIIHVHSPFIIGHTGAYFARKLDIPLVFTYHTLYDQYAHYFPFASVLVQKVVISIARDFCNRCDLVITPTGVVKQLLTGYGIETQVVPIPTGIQTERFQKGDSSFLSRQFEIPPEQKILLYVGRLGKEKNLDFLLRSFSLVLQNYPEVFLVIVGSGPEEESLKEEAREMGIGARVIFTGLLTPDVVTDVYRSSDCFVFPSVTETQGLVLVEAMASGLPVVAKAAFGSLAMVDDGVTGFLCEQGEERFAEYILRLLKEPELRKRMGDAALKRAMRLSADKMALRLESVYQALIAGDQGMIDHLADESI